MESGLGKRKPVSVVGGGLFLGFFVVLGILIASAVLSLINGQAVNRDNTLLDHYQEVLQAETEVSANVAFVESSARGFIVSNNPEFYTEFKDGKSQCYTSIKILQFLAGDDVQQRMDTQGLEELVVARFTDLDKGILRHKQGLPARSTKDPQSLAVLETRDKIFQILREIRSREKNLMHASQTKRNDSVGLATLGFWCSSLIGFISISAFFAVVLRYFDSLKRLRLVEQSRAIELEERVHERTTELSQANKDLEAFSYSVSHDLRAPLRAMHGYASILKKDSSDHLTQEDLRMLDRILKNCTKMSELTESLLALFRVGKTDLMVEEVNISALAAEVVQDLTTYYAGVNYKITIQPRLKEIGDRQMLRALLVNLIGNAIKFSSCVEKPTIEVSREELRGEQVFTIRDNGAGFDPTQSGLLFEPFQRLHTEREFAGNGIGLAMCRKIITRHRGSIWLESELGHGTTVFFTLDLAGEVREAVDSRSKVSLS